MQKNHKHLQKNKKGAAIVEYVVLLGLIAVVTVTVALDFGGNLKGTFESVENTLVEHIDLDREDEVQDELAAEDEFEGLPGDPFGGMFPPPDDDDLLPESAYMIMDGCVVHGESGDWVWCANSNPPTNSEFGSHSVDAGGVLEFRSRNGQECAYDTTPSYDNWVAGMMGPMGIEPGNNDNLSCQTP